MPLFRNENYFLSIAFKCGFNSLEYFSETFKKIVGVSPTIYKKYISYDNSITKKQEDIILSNLNSINTIKNNMSKYLSNRKPVTSPVKKITI